MAKTEEKLKSQFEKFDENVRALFAVPHAELKEKLTAEKRKKQASKRKKIA